MGLDGGVQRRLGRLGPHPQRRPPIKRKSETPIVSIWGDDFDGDGLLDLAFQEGHSLELWHNRGEDGFATILQLSNVGFIGLADGEGDGDVDLLVTEYEEHDEEALHGHEGPSQATLWSKRRRRGVCPRRSGSPRQRGGVLA